MGIFGVVAISCVSAVLWLVVREVAAELATVALLLFTVVSVISGHALTTWWAVSTRLKWPQWIITQAPYIVLYVMTYVWFFGGYLPSEGGPPSLWYLPWVGFALIALSWLWVWWWQGDIKNPRRAIAFLTGLLILLGGNGIAAAVVTFRNTEGFGHQGQPSPGHAVIAFASTSCLFKHDWYYRAGKTVEAHCPPRTESSAAEEFDTYTTNGQPQEQLARWHEYRKQFAYKPQLEYRTISEEHQGDSVVIVRLEVEQPLRSEGQDLTRIPPADYWCILDDRREVWTLHMETVPFGGWKVARLDVTDPIEILPFIGSPCQHRSAVINQ